MGVVYGAVDRRGLAVALKTVHPELAADPDFRSRFAREAELAERVRVPQVPGFRAADPAAEPPWLATEYLAGSPLADLLGTGPERGALPEPLVYGLLRSTALALAGIHAAGVVHRDLKPANIMVTAAGPRLLDLGIARAVEQTALTRTGTSVGTPGWSSPEQYRGDDPTDRSDVFVWGLLACRLATGRHPFGDGRPDTLAVRILEDEPDLSELPGELRPLVERALAKEPGRRPSASEIARELAGSVAERPVLWDRVVPPDQHSARWKELVPRPTRVRPSRGGRRRVLLPVTSAAVAVALTAVSVAVPQVRSLTWDRLGAPGTDVATDPPGAASTEQGQATAATSGPAPIDPGGDETLVAVLDEGTMSVVRRDFYVLRGSVSADDETVPGGSAVGELPVVELSFDESVRTEGGSTIFDVTAEYLLDFGELPVLGEDFAALLAGDGSSLPASPQRVTGPEGEVLATLTPEEPRSEFSVALPGVLDAGAITYTTAPVDPGPQDPFNGFCFSSNPSSGTHNPSIEGVKLYFINETPSSAGLSECL